MSRPPLDLPAGVVIAAVVAMARPSQLLLVAAVMLLGTAFAVARGASADPAAMLVGLVALLPVAAGIHLANEYADHETDRLTSRTPFSGGSGTLVRTGLPRSIALRAAQVATLAGFGAALAGWAGVLPGPALVILGIGMLAWPDVVAVAGLSAVPLLVVGARLVHAPRVAAPDGRRHDLARPRPAGSVGARRAGMRPRHRPVRARVGLMSAQSALSVAGSPPPEAPAGDRITIAVSLERRAA